MLLLRVRETFDIMTREVQLPQLWQAGLDAMSLHCARIVPYKCVSM